MTNSYPTSNGHNFEIKLVTTSEELDTLFQARYEVFVSEGHYLQPRNDQRIFDHFDLDPSSKNIVAEINSKIVGGIRGVQKTIKGSPPEEFFDFSPFLTANTDTIGTGSMFWVKNEFRTTELAFLLLDALNDLGLASNWTHIITSVNPVIQNLLLLEGYRALTHTQYSNKLQLPFVPMILDLSDLSMPSVLIPQSEQRLHH